MSANCAIHLSCYRIAGASETGSQRTLANWNAKAPAQEEIPFIVARIVLQDFTGVPLLVDLAAMRSAVARMQIMFMSMGEPLLNQKDLRLG